MKRITKALREIGACLSLPSGLPLRDFQEAQEIFTVRPPFKNPSLYEIDGIEISPVAFYPYGEPDDRHSGVDCERVSAKEAHMWSVYFHATDRGAWCVGDFPNKRAAMKYARRLLKVCKGQGLDMPHGISVEEF